MYVFASASLRNVSHRVLSFFFNVATDVGTQGKDGERERCLIVVVLGEPSSPSVASCTTKPAPVGRCCLFCNNSPSSPTRILVCSVVFAFPPLQCYAGAWASRHRPSAGARPSRMPEGSTLCGCGPPLSIRCGACMWLANLSCHSSLLPFSLRPAHPCRVRGLLLSFIAAHGTTPLSRGRADNTCIDICVRNAAAPRNRRRIRRKRRETNQRPFRVSDSQAP